MTIAQTIDERKTTHKEAYAKYANLQKNAVCKILQWSEQMYADYQYTTGLQYLYWYLPCNETARYDLERSKLFWNWFKQQWNSRDYEFRHEHNIEVHGLQLRRGMYEALHNPRELAVEMKPNNVVLNCIKTPLKYELHTK